jgi:homocysteine S-methyltransferase
MDGAFGLQSRLNRGEVVLTEAAVVERVRHEFRIPADDQLVYGAAIYDPRAREALRRIYRGYIEVARRHGLPLLLASSTRRSSPERIAASRFAGHEVIGDWMAFLREVRGSDRGDVYLGGLLGSRGDAYRPQEALPAGEALAFHRAQCRAFLDAGADYLVAATLPALSEALGLAAAMGETGLPFIVSFVVDRSGLLLDGTPLGLAMATIDDVSPPLCYLVNCVHPATVLAGLAAHPDQARSALTRLKGIQANTSTLSPSELDDSADLRRDGADALVEAMLTLRREHGFQIFGGCCGSDATHLEKIAAGLSATTALAAGEAG